MLMDTQRCMLKLIHLNQLWATRNTNSIECASFDVDKRILRRHCIYCPCVEKKLVMTDWCSEWALGGSHAFPASFKGTRASVLWAYAYFYTLSGQSHRSWNTSSPLCSTKICWSDVSNHWQHSHQLYGLFQKIRNL